MKIGNKIKLSLFAVTGTVVVLTVFFCSFISRWALREAVSDHLSTTARSRANHIETLLDGYKSQIALVAKDNRIQACLSTVAQQGRTGETGKELNDVLKELTEESCQFAGVLVLDSEGTVVGSTYPVNDAPDMSNDPCFLQGRDTTYIGEAFRDENNAAGVFSIAAPVMEQAQMLGVVVTRINMNSLNKITSARTGLGKTGEIYITNSKGYMVTRSRFVKDAFLKQKVDTAITRECVEEVTASRRHKHHQEVVTYPSYTGTKVIGLHAHIESMPWCLCAEISEEEAFASLTVLKILAFLILCAASLLAWMIGDLTSYVLIKPIKKLQEGIQRFSHGQLEWRVGTTAADEIGDLARSFDEMAENLRATMTSVETLNREVEHRKKTEESLRLARDQAETATAAKSEFLSNISHEIRTPMNAIIGFTDILREETYNKEQLDHLNIIHQCCHNLLQLINDLLDLSKIEIGKMDIQTEEFSLQTLLRATEALLRPLAKEKSIDLKFTRSARVPEKMCTDSDRLYQCLVNLIGNAIKFTDKGHVHVNVSTTEIESRSFIRFDVEDTGPGIPPEKQENVFEPFIQADGSMTRPHSGTGLGLALVKRLAELFGGHVTLTSTKGAGSVFSLFIPLVDVDGQPVKLDAEAEAHSESDPSAAEFRTTADMRCKVPSRILVAEDNLTNKELIRILLEKMGHKVVQAKDGIEAVEKAMTDDIDLIFMDMQMPNMSGYDATRIIKEKGLDVPVIALTAHVMQGDREKCMRTGCVDYMSKPIDYRKLLTVLNTYLPAATDSQDIQLEEIAAD